MKTIIKSLAVLFVVNFALVAESLAETYIYKVTATTTNPAQLDGWFDSTGTTPLTQLPDITNGENDIVIQGTSGSNWTMLSLGQENVLVKSLTVNTISNWNIVTTTLGGSISTLGNLTIGSNSTSCIGGSVAVNVGGDLYLTSVQSAGLGDVRVNRGTLTSLVVNGKTYINMNAANVPCFYVRKAGASLLNPDAIFKDIITSTETAISYDKILQFGSVWENPTGAGSAYVWYNGIEGNVGIASTGSSASECNVAYVFTNNNSSQVATMGINKSYISAKQSRHVLPELTKLVMMSANYDSNNVITSYANYSQTFKGDEMYFSGGVQMISGGLFLNYNASVNPESHGTLELCAASGATATFGNSFGKTNVAGGTFTFTNILVSADGGTINVGLGSTIVSESEVLLSDVVVLTGNTSVTGSGVVKIAFSAPESTYAEDYIHFFVADSAENGVKVISWAEAASNGVNFVAADEWATRDIDVNGETETYKLELFNGADGLYAAYVAVPEPATYAAILGVLALAIAVYRRRK